MCIIENLNDPELSLNESPNIVLLQFFVESKPARSAEVVSRTAVRSAKCKFLYAHKVNVSH